jgi:hypothetical protein
MGRSSPAVTAVDWTPSYRRLVHRYVRKHFGSAQGVTDLFPYMKPDFRIKGGGDDVFAPRITLKSNNEYHGIERHARQYHAVGMYDSAAEHWLIAAAWRHDVMKANRNFDDRHVEAMEFALKNFRFNRSLDRWQKRLHRTCPRADRFGLDQSKIDLSDQRSEGEINTVYRSHGQAPPFSSG